MRSRAARLVYRTACALVVMVLALLCVGACVLWIRSHSWADEIDARIGPLPATDARGVRIKIHSTPGFFSVNASWEVQDGVDGKLLLAKWEQHRVESGAYSFVRGMAPQPRPTQPWFIAQKYTTSAVPANLNYHCWIEVPYWFTIIVFGAALALIWILRRRNRHRASQRGFPTEVA